MLFLAIKVSIHTYIFPGYKSFQMLAFAFITFVLSVFSELFKLPHFMDWRGAGLGTLILFGLYLLSLKENDYYDKE